MSELPETAVSYFRNRSSARQGRRKRYCTLNWLALPVTEYRIYVVHPPDRGELLSCDRKTISYVRTSKTAADVNKDRDTQTFPAPTKPEVPVLLRYHLPYFLYLMLPGYIALESGNQQQCKHLSKSEEYIRSPRHGFSSRFELSLTGRQAIDLSQAATMTNDNLVLSAVTTQLRHKLGYGFQILPFDPL
ncbi:hypothetical protein BJ508DRAFT_309752 [Ascobolus immersus RN42]|uniref:Uncharacterized protein n=1 Tax=Ascobolus immersus RN42 TaxID=1160509 RepID=A0A3N4HXT6_ASCIM|nr:hypothetical protein BJ508DRAFT_309752 [Ascobolus immersus RN42]